jgi:D-glycero-alpha-D-manno-heptose-7-phosphate kinase
MILTRTPFRVSFAGGGSDLPEFYRRSAGAVLSCTIDKAMYIAVHPYFPRQNSHQVFADRRRSQCRGSGTPLVRECLNLVASNAEWRLRALRTCRRGRAWARAARLPVGLLHALWAKSGRIPVHRNWPRLPAKLKSNEPKSR